MPVATTDDGVSISWEAQGEGPPLVLLHGVTEDSLLWKSIADELSERFRVILVDLRGHGRSGEATDYSPLVMTGDVAAVVRAADVEAPSVVGHSLGGLVATAYASEHDVHAVVNVDLSLDTRPIAARIRMLETNLRGPSYVPTLRSMFAMLAGDRLPQETRAAIDDYAARAPREVVLGVYDILLRTPDDELLRMNEEMLDKIRAPYLLLHSVNPGPEYLSWLTSHLPSATVEVWPNSGHFLHLLDPERFVQRVVDFLAA
jgi:pimeloyl-ACP methyl ester carboxylesterase